ncbi:hypothetical protein LIER_36452 [Lithospermum erythrorhizon]|uniref:Uncharacterized protein n=1 Tax=Lithospermum erythrorhizon TaxID=34254 RepID=A0AAV3P6W8_LITER
MLLLTTLPPPPPPKIRFSSPSFCRRNISVSLASSNRNSIKFNTNKKNEELDGFTQYSGYIFELNNDVEALSEYDIGYISGVYVKKPFILLRRLLQIASTLGKWFALRYSHGQGRSHQLITSKYIKYLFLNYVVRII